MSNINIVRQQLQLSFLGYYAGIVDGIANNNLTEAIKKFQGDNSLTTDGIVGPKTTEALRIKTAGKLMLLVLHCTATPRGLDVKASNIVDYHLKNRGWSRPGYSVIWELDGKEVRVRDYNDDDIISEWEYSNGMLGEFNRNARHVCYVGGVSNEINNRGDRPAEDTRTINQIQSMTRYVKDIVEKYPNIVIIGHNAVQNKGCPSFAWVQWLKSIDIKDKNIGQFKLY